jgi:hypothetical protein
MPQQLSAFQQDTVHRPSPGAPTNALFITVLAIPNFKRSPLRAQWTNLCVPLHQDGEHVEHASLLGSTLLQNHAAAQLVHRSSSGQNWSCLSAYIASRSQPIGRAD